MATNSRRIEAQRQRRPVEQKDLRSHTQLQRQGPYQCSFECGRIRNYFRTLKNLKMDYNKLAIKAYEDAKANGWYEKKQPINTRLILIKSELYEAFEAFRGKDYAPSSAHLTALQTACFFNEDHIIIFKAQIKDTFEDEIADTAIRIFDFCGWYGIELGTIKKIQTKPRGQYDSDLVYLDKVITSTFDLTDKERISMSFRYLLGALESIAEVYEFDLEQHIVLKMAYNKTRGHKHGGKVL
jgi:NTP pyrophosphatase (non-canonical NTP hydrolase)